MKLNLQNIEDLIFFDKKVQSILPELTHYFDGWRLSKRVPGLQNLGKRSLNDFLNSLEVEHLERLSKYFGEEILIEKIDYHIIRNEVFALDVCGEEMCHLSDYKEFCCYRDNDTLYISMWK